MTMANVRGGHARISLLGTTHIQIELFILELSQYDEDKPQLPGGSPADIPSGMVDSCE